MSTVQRSEIVDYQTYEEIRSELQKKVFSAKARRRIHVGECFTFLFENALTIRYQVQEMMRAEKIVKEKDILHELDTYNALIGTGGDLGCTLLIEIDDLEERAVKLREWFTLPEHIYVRLENGAMLRSSFDPSQVGRERLSSVQYLKFPVQGHAPVTIGIDLPGIESETELTRDQREAMAEDLG
jgi:hypothetical protein